MSEYDLQGLAGRERDVFELLGAGLSDEEIAGRLEMSPASVRYQIAQLVAKFGLAGRDELVARAAGRRFGALAVASQAARTSFRLSLPRLTPLRGLLLTATAFVALLYVWGIFFDNEPDPARIAVRWLQADPRQADFDELPRPYASTLAGVAPDVWRGYVIETGGAPRLVIESNRQLTATSWSQDGSRLVFTFLSQGTRGERLLGSIAMDAREGREVWDMTFPFSSASGFFTRPERSVVLGTAPVSNDTAVFVIEPDGSSRQLSGEWESVSPVGWSPDGNTLLLNLVRQRSDAGNSDFDGEYYVTRPYEGAAFLVGSFDYAPVWSPDGRRLAGFDEGSLVIVEVAKRKEKRVSLGGAISDASPGRLAAGPAWSGDSRYVSYAGAVVEAASGRLVTPPSAGSTLTAVSPDGSWLAVVSDSSVCPQPSGQRTGVRPNRTLLRAVEGGREVVLLDCAAGAQAAPVWLSASSLLLFGNVCPAPCTRAGLLLALASVPGAQVRDLVQRTETGNLGVAVAPDLRSFVIGGRSLRIFDASGALQRTIDAPEGLQVSGISWSKDGRSLAYVVGPSLRGLGPGGFPP